MKRSITVLLLYLSLSNVFAQSKGELFELGNAAFKNEAYITAINYYLNIINNNNTCNYTRPYEIKQYKKNKNNTSRFKTNTTVKEAYVIRQLAESYRLNHDYKNAEIWYKKLLDTHSLEYPLEHFWYGDILMKNQQYPDAIKEFNSILQTTLNSDVTIYNLAKNKIKGCEDACDSSNYKKNISLVLLDSVINKGLSSFAVNYFGDANTLQFSNAQTTTVAQEVSLNCDIYTIQKTKKSWKNLKKLEKIINSENHEAAGFLTANGNNYYFTRWSLTDKNDCAIYLSKKINNKWVTTEKLDEYINLEGYKTMQPTLSDDGKTLYFSSNRPGGFGKMDLWYINIDEQGKTQGIPVNMGATFNTPEDEVSPFYHAETGSLYFSSEGLPGIGGLDIFKSTYSNESLSWSTPKNLRMPINSSKDDAYFIINPTGHEGYLSSDRADCKTCTGSACYKIYSFDQAIDSCTFRGIVLNAENNKPVANALITIKNKDMGSRHLLSDSSGKFLISVKEDLELNVRVQKNKFFGDAATIPVTGLTNTAERETEFFLSPIPYGEIIIPGIEYDPGKATLTKETKKILNELYDFLILNNNLNIELSSHTDERGDDEKNMKLSQARAQTCVDYLVSKGIDLKRITAKGYGESRLLIYDAKTEEEHQKNNRTAFRSVKETEIRKY